MRLTMRSPLALTSLLLASSVTAKPLDVIMKRDLTLVGCYSSDEGLTNKTSYEYQSSGWCYNHCLDNYNSAVFGMNAGSNCFCGDELPPKSSLVDSSKCDTACQGWPTDMCGGGTSYWSIYTTGTESDVPVYAASTTTAAGASTATGTKADGTDAASKTDSAAVVAETTTDANGDTVVVTATASSSSSGKTTSATSKESQEELNKSKRATATIAAGVVLGVVGVAAIAGAAFLFFRSRKSKTRGFRDVPDYNRNSQMPEMSSRFDGDFMAQRRQSNGSIEDDKDFSRRILQVRTY
ncbi:hypothetical protein N7495_003636 [Penicillium taxi]|uniref:uncharacterized protein n=1 Tax=Penicillium taxi TaxID=168475 RepID=UPI00254560E3|nr:uncharacterized protein N7495_003636 [Penicillium taxi]KAJ5898892.1 hypothetical protein N7495_003636 [Penicillium taxi]